MDDKDLDKIKELGELAELTQAIEAEPENAEAYYNRGYFYYNQLKDYDKALEDYDKAIEVDPKYTLVYNNRGVLYQNQFKDYDKALEDYDKAIEVNPQYALAYRNRGVLYYEQLKDYDKALSDFNKAIELDPKYVSVYNHRGVLYKSQLKDYDKAFADYNKAIELDSTNAQAYNNRALLYDTQFENYDKALEDYNKAIEVNPQYALAYNNRGALYETLEKYDEALNDYNKAIKHDKSFALAYKNRGELYLDQFKDYTNAFSDFTKAKELYTGVDNSRLKFVEGKIKETLALQSIADDDNICVKDLMDKIDASTIAQSINETRKTFKTFINEKQFSPTQKMESESEFVILRRWNSYTPIISGTNRISKGGGYFFKLPNCGIAIDPGFNFIDNFKSEGYQFHEIDHILITHAHNDHTTDLESILTLLHQYNESILGDFYIKDPDEDTIMKEVLNEQTAPITDEDEDCITAIARDRFSKSSRLKRIRIYMSESTYKKYSPMLNLHKSSNYDIIIIRASDTLPIICPNSSTENPYLEITAISAKHDDLISNRDSLGFIISYKDFVLFYTGDTGFDTDIAEKYKAAKDKYKDKNIVLLAHIGGFKEYERKFNFSQGIKENKNFFYKNHLGRLGLAKLIEAVEPKICIISEFGEEFRKTRRDLTKIYSDVYTDTFFIPADIGLRITDKNMIRLIDKKDFTKNYYDYKETLVCERQIDASLHYYKKGLCKELELVQSLSDIYHSQLHQF